jgi:hypothetical protein
VARLSGLLSGRMLRREGREACASYPGRKKTLARIKGARQNAIELLTYSVYLPRNDIVPSVRLASAHDDADDVTSAIDFWSLAGLRPLD